MKLRAIGGWVGGWGLLHGRALFSQVQNFLIVYSERYAAIAGGLY